MLFFKLHVSLLFSSVISNTVWTCFNSMKRASSLNYLNKTSDDSFQVKNGFWKVKLNSVSCSSLLMCICVLRFFVRIVEAVISGWAEAWAPAPWISTPETEQQASLSLCVYLLNLSTNPKMLLPLALSLWATTTLPDSASSQTLFPNTPVGQRRTSSQNLNQTFPLIKTNTYTSVWFFSFQLVSCLPLPDCFLLLLLIICAS